MTEKSNKMIFIPFVMKELTMVILKHANIVFYYLLSAESSKATRTQLAKQVVKK